MKSATVGPISTSAPSTVPALTPDAQMNAASPLETWPPSAKTRSLDHPSPTVKVNAGSNGAVV
jgi:hypothetical protein